MAYRCEKTIDIEELITVDGRKYYKQFYEYCLKNNLWTGFARERAENSTYDQTTKAVRAWLMPLITEKSNYTKGALMKYARENYNGPCAYKDVGKVVSSIVKEQTTSRFGKWEKATTNNYIRLRGNYAKRNTT